MEVRVLDATEVGLAEALGALTVRAYRGPYPEVDADGYAEELADVVRRADVAVVLVALDGGELLGGVTYVPDRTNPLDEAGVEGAASIRMLAVDPAIEGRGVGEALVRACLDRAVADGQAEMVLHSTGAMTRAHRLYERLGFRRDDSLDWWPEPDLLLLGFRRALSP